jgi:pimeloyl-ACP methyl ester carboxylesterase
MNPLAFDPHATDPPLLKNNSKFKSYKTSHAEYPEIRVFFRQHAKADELYRANGPLPLLVFIPGLGGSVAQFHPLLSSLVDLAPCLSMDWPGGGRSGFAPTTWEAYAPEALGELLEAIIEDHRDKEAEQTVALIGHSMGTAYSAWLANTKVAHTTPLAKYVVGVIGICPLASPLNEQATAWVRRLLWVPGWIFDLWRAWDGMGGPDSPSVNRFVGEDADKELKVLQYRYNKQSRTPVWRRMFYGWLPTYQDGKAVGGMTDMLASWADLDVPVYLIAAENDTLTPPTEVDKIVEAMKKGSRIGAGTGKDISASDEELAAASAAPINDSTSLRSHIPQTIDDITDGTFTNDRKSRSRSRPPSSDDPDDDPSTPEESPAGVPPQLRIPHKAVQSIVMPAPATHAVLYSPRSVRAMAGLISDFLATHITGRLSLAWQLQYLSKEGKWDVKNLNKWKSVAPVSAPIGPANAPVFRAMKTLREADDVHCPSEFAAAWGEVVGHIVDISKDQPVYDPRGLERAGIHYHKFPTVSKVPPQSHEVDGFIQLIDDLRRADGENDKRLIGVHCHYGFNRTGYFIVCYLVERCGFGVQEAIEAFAEARPNGIRHSHFLDRLYVRYNVDGPLK